MSTQISPGALHTILEAPDTRIIDGSWALDGTDMHTLYVREHIPGAQFFDLEAVSDHTTSLPHMAPTPEQFATAIGAMGISATDHVVIYDRQGLFSAPRVWWTFKLMGHDRVQVLRGGLLAWREAGFPVSSSVESASAVYYEVHRRANKVIDINGLRDSLGKKGYLVLDARPATRFAGSASEPRPGLRSGHMPGSRNLPFSRLIENGSLKSGEALKTIFSDLGMASTEQVITTCGSGVTAAILSMALYEIGHTQALLYDGSWAEWGQEILDTPVVSGEF